MTRICVLVLFWDPSLTPQVVVLGKLYFVPQYSPGLEATVLKYRGMQNLKFLSKELKQNYCIGGENFKT